MQSKVVITVDDQASAILRNFTERLERSAQILRGQAETIDYVIGGMILAIGVVIGMILGGLLAIGFASLP